MLNQLEILSLLPIAVMLLDRAGRCIYANPRWQELSGLSRDAGADEGWMQAFYAPDLRRLRQEMNNHSARTGSFTFECRLTPPTKQPRRVKLHLQALPQASAQFGSYLLTVEDLAANNHSPSTFETVPDHNKLKALTPRQHEVLRLISSGYSTKEIAHLLSISVKTVETHRKDLMERLGIQSLPRLILFAVRSGVVSPEQ